MTNEEAMSNLEKLLQLYDDGMIDFSIIRESIKVAIKAMKKQIPKKPQEGNVHIVYLCPNCGSLDFTFPYCRHCGQRLSEKPDTDSKQSEEKEKE